MGIKLEDLLAKGYKFQGEPYSIPLPPKKRIRQNTKPLSNKLEAEFGQYLKLIHHGATMYEQSITVRLANGLRYTPDWVVCEHGNVICYEVKGKHVWDDSIAKLKMAASVYPMWIWSLAWKDNIKWTAQRVLS